MTPTVTRHAECALVALNDRLPRPASVYLARLAELDVDPDRSIAIELCRMTMAVGLWSGSSNGDSVVVVIREGQVRTTMLRRTWNQPFTPDALRVDEVQSWA